MQHTFFLLSSSLFPLFYQHWTDIDTLDYNFVSSNHEVYHPHCFPDLIVKESTTVKAGAVKHVIETAIKFHHYYTYDV